MSFRWIGDRIQEGSHLQAAVGVLNIAKLSDDVVLGGAVAPVGLPPWPEPGLFSPLFPILPHKVLVTRPGSFFKRDTLWSGYEKHSAPEAFLAGPSKERLKREQVGRLVIARRYVS